MRNLRAAMAMVLLAASSATAEVCMSPYVKRLNGREKYLYVFCVDADAKDNDFVADNVDKVLALDAATGAAKWRTTVAARPNTALVVVGSTLVVGTADGYLNWIALDSGKVKKRVRLDGMPYGTPILASPLLFVLTAGAKGNLIALDVESGAVRWSRETPKEWTTYCPLITGSTVIVGSEEKDLCAFNRDDGELSGVVRRVR